MKRQNRRSFLTTTIAAGCATALIPAATFASGRKSKQPKPILLGGPSFSNSSDPEELARAHRTLGYSAAYCPAIAVADAGKIRAFREAFAKHSIVFAEVGRWVNLMDADPGKRKENLEKVTDGLALAEEIGARCCVDIAGSFNPTSWFGPHPDNFSRMHFDASVENARRIIDAVKPTRTHFCYEMMGWAHPHDVESCLKLLRAVDRKGFAVHLDPCNLINSPHKFYDNTALLNECFDKLGRWIVSCHAKDLVWDVEMNIHFREVAPGKGTLDYATFLKRLARLPQQPPLMLEHMPNAEEYKAGADYIRAVGGRETLSFA
jgi:sugar phosphate isomerase/epimerase